MMKLRVVLFFFISAAFFLNACNYSRHDQTNPQPVNYSVVSSTLLFNKKNISFRIDSSDNYISMNLHFNEMKNFPFPVDQQYKDTLFNTVFQFSLSSNGKPLRSEYCSLMNTSRWYTDSTGQADILTITSDTISLKHENDLTIRIPFSAFHNLKKGKQTIELSMSQSLFTTTADVMRKDSSYDHLHLYAVKPLLEAKVKFDIMVPAIYKSIVYGMGIELRNDSSFSPAGMDNTLWNSSYPDIYWVLYSPKDHFYAQTPYEASTAKYIAHDTFNLYHYNADEELGIGVYDHDNFSRDDRLGYWTGNLNFLEKRPITRITFGAVKSFDVIVQKKGIVN